MVSVKARSAVFSHHHHTGELPKSKSRTVVKPILRKLHSHSDRRESSLDLDRGWDDQPSPGFAAGPDFGTYDSDASYHRHSTASAMGGARNGRDWHFSLSSAADLAGTGGCGGRLGGYAGGGAGTGAGTAGPGPGPGPMAAHASAAAAAAAIAGAREGGVRCRYSHGRSASGTSHASSIATSTSGRNGGTFVHPFQQTPQTPTPPLSYTNSRASLENGLATGYSPTITEDDDDDDAVACSPFPSHSNSTTTTTTTTTTIPRPAALLYQSSSTATTAYFQHPSHRRPSLASRRTSSLSDGTQATTRLSDTRSPSAAQPRSTAASVNQSSLSELDWSSTPCLAAPDDSPLSATAHANVTSSTSSTTPMSPLRHSLDMGGFRLRSRSELDTATHQEHVREARRKFEAKERAKEEKYAREQHRKRERAETKETHRLEKTHSRLRNGSLPGSTPSSTGTGIRITSQPRRGAKSSADDTREKALDFAAHGFGSTHAGQPSPAARADDVCFTPSKRTRTAKHKTVGVWTAFVLWLRTRLLKLGRR